MKLRGRYRYTVLIQTFLVLEGGGHGIWFVFVHATSFNAEEFHLF